METRGVMLTICMHCSRVIRDGYASVGTSHGICDRCMARHYPDVPDQWLALLILALEDAACLEKNREMQECLHAAEAAEEKP